MTRLRRFLKWTLCLLAGLLVVAIVTHVWLDFRYGRELDRLISRLKADGVPLTYEELAAGQPPDGKNAALLVLRAFPPRKPALDDPELKAPYLRYDHLKPGRIDTKLLNEIRSDLRTRGDQLELLHRAAKLPASRYPIVISHVGQFDVLEHNHHRSVRLATSLLGAEAVVRAIDGDSRGAVDTLTAAVRVAESLRNDPGRMSRQVCYSCRRVSMDATAKAVEFGMAPPDLLMLCRELGTIQPNMSLRSAYYGEFPPAISEVHGAGNKLMRIVERPYTRVLSLRGLQMLDRQMSLADRPWRLWPKEDRNGTSFSFVSPGFILADMMAWIGSGVAAARDESQARINGARLAIALKLYHRRTGRYPSTLEQAWGDMGGPLPRDPFSGKPFRYWHDAKGYRFWSIGANLEDDGGRAAEQSSDRPAGDLVWVTGALTPIFISRRAQD